MKVNKTIKILDLNKEGDVHIKFRNNHPKPISDYADFLLAFPSIISGTYLKAHKCFRFNPLSRRYFFQLCVIHEAIWQHLNSRPIMAHPELLKMTRRLSSANFINSASKKYKLTDEEDKLYRDYCIPQLKKRLQELCAENRVANTDLVSTRNFHGPGSLSLLAPRAWVQTTRDYVCNCYSRSLGCPNIEASNA